MRVCVMVKATKDSEAGMMPSEELLAAMGKFNEELVNAGVMLAGEGLHPSSKGARVKFSGGKPAVIDGPFIETKEALGGYSVLDADSIDEAVEIAKTWPGVDRGWITIELRPVIEMG